MPFPPPDDHVGDAQPAGLVETDKESYISPRESIPEEEGNASTETLSPAQSRKDLITSSNASFWTLQPQPDFSLPSQEEANISSNIQTNLLHSLSFSMRIKSKFLLLLKRKLFSTIKKFPIPISQTYCAHSIREINL